LLKSLQILQRKLERRFRQQNTDKLLPNVEGQRTFGIGNLSARYRRLIACGLKPPLPLVAAFKKIGEAYIELLGFIQIALRKKLWIENGNELRIHSQGRVGSQIRCDFLILILENLRSCGSKRVIVSQRQVDRLVQGDAGRILSAARCCEQQNQRRRGEIATKDSTIPGAHRD
jgi:hypothetical protein